MWKLLRFLFLPVVLGKTVIIGDSLFAGGSNIPSLLSQWSGSHIENYAQVGASLVDGWVLSIPKQYNSIENKSNISTLIMDGGGNDVFSLRRDCYLFNQKCKDQIQRSIHTLETFLQNNISAKNIIYLGFYYARGMNQAIDVGMDLLSSVCKEDHEIPCFLIDPRNFSLPLGWDGVHPTNEGYQRLAMAIWDTALLHDIQI